MDQNAVPEAIAGPSNQQSPSIDNTNPPIFKLNVYCFGDIFEYLSKEDLYSLGETCTTLLRITGEYFKRNYCAASIGPYTMPEFDPYKTKLSLYSDNKRYTKNLCRHIQKYSGDFEAIKELRMSSIKIENDTLKCLKRVLAKVDTLEMVDCFMENNFYNFLKQCGNLKRLFIKNSMLGVDYVPLGSGYDSEKYDSDAERPENDYEWLLKSYPKLEHLHLYTDNGYYPPWDKFKAFLNQNPNLRTFSTFGDFIVFNHTEFMKLETNLDTLKLWGRSAISRGYESEWDKFYKTLDKLYAKGFYKRLHLKVSDLNQRFIDEIKTLQGLEKLYINSAGRNMSHVFGASTSKSTFTWHQFPNVTELGFYNGLADDTELLVNAFPNVERLFFDFVPAEEILPFIRSSPKVNKIKAKFKNISIKHQVVKMQKGRKRVINEIQSIPPVLNLQKWNKEREQLQGARKIIIYVKDDVFLATKWATPNGVTNLSMIEMKRYDACEWDRFMAWEI